MTRPDQDAPADSVPRPCPRCGADWKRTEFVSEAHRGGGYRVLCHACGHLWDDAHASYGEREAARRAALRPVVGGSPVAIEIRRLVSPKWQMRVLDEYGTVLDSTYTSTRWMAWRLAKSSWRHLHRAALDSSGDPAS